MYIFLLRGDVEIFGLVSKQALRWLGVRDSYTFLGHSWERRTPGSFWEILQGEGNSYAKTEALLISGYLKFCFATHALAKCTESIAPCNVLSTQKIINFQEPLGAFEMTFQRHGNYL